jgi:hypothetical protein
MAKIRGDGIQKNSSYEARPAMAGGLYWLSELPGSEIEPTTDWKVAVEEKLAKAVRQQFGGGGKSFRDAVDLALKKSLL